VRESFSKFAMQFSTLFFILLVKSIAGATIAVEENLGMRTFYGYYHKN